MTWPMSYFGLYADPYNSLIKRENPKTITAIYISQRHAKNKNSIKNWKSSLVIVLTKNGNWIVINLS